MKKIKSILYLMMILVTLKHQIVTLIFSIIWKSTQISQNFTI